MTLTTTSRVPSVTVVIATFNRADHLPRALDSVLAQDDVELEVVLVDDGSTDETPAVAERYRDRIRYTRQENRERGAARNRGLREASGDLVAFFDSDDEMLPGHLRGLATALQGSPDSGIAYSRSIFVDDLTDEPFDVVPHDPPRGDAFLEMVEHNVVTQSSILLRRSLLDEVGAYDEDRALSGAEDWELWCRCLAVSPLLFVDQTTVRIYFHPENTVGDAGKMDAALRLARRKILDVPDHRERIRGHERRLTASFYVTLAYHWMLTGDPRTARARLLEAVRDEPGVLLEADWLVMFLKTLVGRKVMDRLRDVRRYRRLQARGLQGTRPR